MYIKHLIGARKGEIEDVIFDAAKRKVELGEAEDVYCQLPQSRKVTVMQPEALSTRADAVEVGAAKRKKR